VSTTQVVHLTFPQATCAPHGIRELLGDSAWMRLPPAVRARFAETADAVDYGGEFEIIRASLIGRMIAWACQLIGTPVVPRTGNDVPAIVHVEASERGVEWRREYRWPGLAPIIVRSTKVVSTDGTLVEELPARLCMTLCVYEEAGALHFVSRGYYFDVALPGARRHVRLMLPSWLTPGTTHVQHIDQTAGWFRFSMTVNHPLLGEVFHQTGLFHALGG
jgi:Domain of unknown function (DUF4166)